MGKNLTYDLSSIKLHNWDHTNYKAVFEDFEALEKEYLTSIQPKVNNAIEITVIVSKNVLNKMKKTYLKDSNCLEKNTRHKFFLNFKIDDHTQLGNPPIPINFYLSKLENPEASNFRCSEPTSGKDFLTWKYVYE